MVTPEMSAQDRKWWTDERYAIYELNVNSAVAHPQHEEVLDLTTAGPSYTVKGYAYAGGGRRITKVEISLDRGKCEHLFSRFLASANFLLVQHGVFLISNMQKTNTVTSKVTSLAAKWICGGGNPASAGHFGRLISQYQT